MANLSVAETMELVDCLMKSNREHVKQEHGGDPVDWAVAMQIVADIAKASAEHSCRKNGVDPEQVANRIAELRLISDASIDSVKAAFAAKANAPGSHGN